MKTNYRIILAFVIGLSFTNVADAAGEVYRYKNAEGNIVYSDRKPTAKYEVVKRVNNKPSAAPTSEVEAAEQTVVTRSVEEVRTLTDTIKPEINGLYTQLVAKDNATQGNVTVSFTIAQTGAVTHCAENETEMKGAKFNGSICEKVSNLQFDPAANPDPVRLTFTYNFDQPS